MTISSTANRASYNGNGVTTAFSFPYYFLANGDLTVILVDTTTDVETVQTITTHYTVTGAGVGAGGTVTFVTAPATGKRVVILREVDFTQETDWVDNDPLTAASLENAIDKVTMGLQQVDEELGRTVQFSRGLTTSGILIEEEPEAGALLLYNDDGDGIINGPTGDDIADAGANATAAAASAAAAAVSETNAETAETNAETALATVEAIAAAYTGNDVVDTFSGTGAQTAFTLSVDPGSENNTDVFIGGVYQNKSEYSVSGTTLTFTAAPASGTNNVEVVYSRTLPIGTPGNGTVGAAQSAYGLVNSQTAETAVATDDEVLLGDTSLTALRKMTVANFFKAAASLSAQNIIPNGMVIDRVYSEYTANSDLTTTIPADDTIPQNTEGSEILTASITPKSATNRVRIRFQGFGGTSAGSLAMVAALFIDSTANALTAHAVTVVGNDTPTHISFEFEHVPGDTAAHTYKIRVGPSSAATMRMNGDDDSRMFGGVARSTLVLEEIKSA